jgi:hypothetical protein
MKTSEITSFKKLEMLEALYTKLGKSNEFKQLTVSQAFNEANRVIESLCTTQPSVQTQNGNRNPIYAQAQKAEILIQTFSKECKSNGLKLSLATSLFLRLEILGNGEVHPLQIQYHQSNKEQKALILDEILVGFL